MYNRGNYVFNTKYPREFNNKIRSEGANFLKQLGRNRSGPSNSLKKVIQSGQSSDLKDENEFLTEQEIHERQVKD